MTTVFFVIYNFIFVPVFFLGIHLAALFHPKVRQGLLGRYRTMRILRRELADFSGKNTMVVHCASMGEFEHIKPFLFQFKRMKPEFKTIVLFFSPSGFENIKSFQAVDLFLYSPIDWFVPVWRFMRKVRPSLWVIAKHDVWPNQVWMARFLNIPLFLINASLHRKSSRLRGISRIFHRSIYQYFTGILTISPDDRHNFLKLADGEKIQVAGDTKYDQVVYRRDESLKKKVIPEHLLRDKWILVAGSTWPEDHKHLIPAVRQIMQNHDNFMVIICPHEPTPQHLQEIADGFEKEHTILLSNVEAIQNQAVIIVDRIGVLANIYSFGKIAYVGGSFKQNIHNVLEPAVYGIPVLFGPVNENSYEAQLLKANGGAFEIQNHTELENQLNKFLSNDIYRRETGLRALQVVEKNTGATLKTVKVIVSELEKK